MNEIERMSDLIKLNIEKLKSYVPEVKEDIKLLSVKSQEKISKFMHKLYGNYNSWTANAIVQSSEKNTPLSDVKKDLDGATEHVGENSVKVIHDGIEKADENLRKSGVFNRKDNIANTFYHCAREVLSQYGKTLSSFADNVESKRDKIAISR